MLNYYSAKTQRLMCGDDVTIPAEGGSQNHTFSIKPVADFLPYGVTFLYDSVFIDKIQKKYLYERAHTLFRS